MEEEAMQVLHRLVTDDDQSVEAWYLGGWCQHLIAEKLRAAGHGGDANMNGEIPESSDSALKGSRNWLNMALKLYTQLDYEDDRLYAHAQELVAELDRLLGPEAKAAEGGAEDEDWEEWDGIEDDGDEAADADEDEEMQDS